MNRLTNDSAHQVVISEVFDRGKHIGDTFPFKIEQHVLKKKNTTPLREQLDQTGAVITLKRIKKIIVI